MDSFADYQYISRKHLSFDNIRRIEGYTAYVQNVENEYPISPYIEAEYLKQIQSLNLQVEFPLNEAIRVCAELLLLIKKANYINQLFIQRAETARIIPEYAYKTPYPLDLLGGWYLEGNIFLFDPAKITYIIHELSHFIVHMAGMIIYPHDNPTFLTVEEDLFRTYIIHYANFA